MTCNHPLMRHTVWYWVHDPNDPYQIPYAVDFDNRKDALAAVSEMIATPPVTLRWVKIFRAHNEAYECYRWKNPEPLPEPEPVDMELNIVTKKHRFRVRAGEEAHHWWQLRR